MCAIIKGLYLKQLAAQDFSYDGKDVTIWTAVETATAIIAASIPVLRVFFKEVASNNYYSSSRSRSHNHRSAKPIQLSGLQRSHTSSHTVTVQAMGKDKNSGWTTLEPIEDGSGDNSSQRGILRDEEQGLSRSDTGIVIHEDDRILQTNTVSVTVEDDTYGHQNRSWIGPPT